MKKKKSKPLFCFKHPLECIDDWSICFGDYMYVRLQKLFHQNKLNVSFRKTLSNLVMVREVK